MYLAPDDLVAGMALIVESVTNELSSFSSPSSDDIRAYYDLQWFMQHGGRPAEVISVSLPFIAIRVFGKSRQDFMYSRNEQQKIGDLLSLDIRRFRLVRCDPRMLQSFVTNELPSTSFDLKAVFGTRAMKLFNKYGIRRIEDLASHYRVGHIKSLAGVGNATMKKIEGIMSMLGVEAYR